MAAKAKPSIWVLTYEVNDYNQEGKYFLAAFAEIPSTRDLAEFLTKRNDLPNNVMAALALVEHIRAGGGRRKEEQTWYHLDKVELQ